jgi:hypothetical protein
LWKAGGTKYASAKLKAQFAEVARPTPLARYWSGKISLYVFVSLGSYRYEGKLLYLTYIQVQGAQVKP